MTYGESSAALQHALADLLARFRRVDRHLGGAVGRHPATRTVPERAELSALVQRFRWPVLLWARDAGAIAATPTLHGSSIGRPGLRVSRALAAWTPPARDLPGGRGPSTGELSTAHEVPVVEAWRRAAVAAVDACERDLPAVQVGSPLSAEDRRDIARDVMAVADALVALDRRWADSDRAWRLLTPTSAKQVLTRSGRGVRALLDATGPPRWEVDDRGAPARTAYPPANAAEAWSQVASAIEETEPSAITLLRVIRKTAVARAHAAGLAREAGRGDLAEAWSRASDELVRLSQYARNVASLDPGDDTRAMDAVREAQAWLERPAGATGADFDLLAVGFAQAEHAIGVRLEDGIGVGTYLGTFTSRLERRAIGGVRHARAFFEPITPDNHPDLLAATADLTRTLPGLLPRPAQRPGRVALAQALQEQHAPVAGGTPRPEHGRGVAALIAEQRAAQANPGGPEPREPR